MTALRGVMALAIAGALAACEDGATSNPSAGSSQPILRTADAAPGPQNPPARFALSVMQTACVETLPDFAGATQALIRAGGFAQSSRTDTFFHQRFDLSVKVSERRCSMVTGTSGKGTGLTQIADLPGVETARPRIFGDRTYFSFFISGKIE